MAWVSETCKICGKSEQIYRMSGKPSSYYVCGDCKLQLEKKPKELVRHLGLALEASHKEETEEIERSKQRTRKS